MNDPGATHSDGKPFGRSSSEVVPTGLEPGIGETGRARHLRSIPVGPVDPVAAARARHPSALRNRRLAGYVDAVARQLEVRGVTATVLAGPGRPAHLTGSIVIDCTAVRSGVDDPEAAHSRIRYSIPDTGGRGHPLPVIAAWDQDDGWVVGLGLGPGSSSCRFVHPDLAPPPVEVAEFVVALARMGPVGDRRP